MSKMLGVDGSKDPPSYENKSRMQPHTTASRAMNTSRCIDRHSPTPSTPSSCKVMIEYIHLLELPRHTMFNMASFVPKNGNGLGVVNDIIHHVEHATNDMYTSSNIKSNRKKLKHMISNS
jgi:hypothetical protein